MQTVVHRDSLTTLIVIASMNLHRDHHSISAKTKSQIVIVAWHELTYSHLMDTEGHGTSSGPWERLLPRRVLQLVQLGQVMPLLGGWV